MRVFITTLDLNVLFCKYSMDSFEATGSHVVLYLYGHKNAHDMLSEDKVDYNTIHKIKLENLQRSLFLFLI